MSRKAITRHLRYRLPVLLYAALLFWASSGPEDVGMFKAAPDYFLHAAAYFVFYILAFLAVHEGCTPRQRWAGAWLPYLITVLYAVSDEFHQSFVPSRDASIIDVLADAAGGLLAAMSLSPTTRLISRFFASSAR